MLLKSLELENIRSYRNEKIEFPEGSILLSGDIGSGKTSLLLAIEFALFGVRGKELDGTTLLRYGKKEGSVKLEFSVAKKDIIIKRKLKKGKKGVTQKAGYIVVNGKKKDATAVELKTLVLDILGYPKDLVSKKKNLIYRYTVYTPQEGMKQILIEDGRIDTLRKVFGIDKYKRIRENANVMIREIKEKRKLLEQKIENLDERKEEVSTKKKEINKLSEEMNKTEDMLKSIVSELKENKEREKSIEKDMKQLSDMRKELEVKEERLKSRVERNSQIKEDIDSYLKSIEDLKKRLISIKIEKPSEEDSELVEKRIEEKERRLRRMIEDETRIKQQIESDKSVILQTEEELKSYRLRIDKYDSLKKEIENNSENIKEKSMLEKDLKKREEILSEIIKKKHNIESKIDNSRNLKKEIGSLEDCPTCLQPVSDDHKKKIHSIEDSKLRENISALEKMKNEEEYITKEISVIKMRLDKILVMEKKNAEMKAELKGIEGIKADASKKKAFLDNKRESIGNFKSKLEDMKKMDKKSVNKEIMQDKELLKKITEYRSMKKESENISSLIREKEAAIVKAESNLKDIRKDIGEINSDKIAITKKMEDYKDSEKDYDVVRRRIADITERERELSVKNAYLKKEREVLIKRNEELSSEIVEMEKIKTKLVEMQQIQEWVDTHFVMLMRVMEKQVMLTVYNEFNEFFQKWFELLVEDETMQARLDEEFTPIIMQNGYDAPINNLSGGERTAAALAYRLALNRVVNDIMTKIRTKDIIILDEPTEGFSSEQLDRVRDVLEELGIRQTLIVSHESKIESFVDNVIKINKDEGNSQILA